MGIFGGSTRRKKSVKAQINKVLKQIEKKKDRSKLATLRKQLRGY
jgi:hypothetical protein